eukprot:Sspe_Gene.44434::Locus_21790_Transcript_1_2_Confidence_0.750_Length_3077::g.44434::m.44434
MASQGEKLIIDVSELKKHMGNLVSICGPINHLNQYLSSIGEYIVQESTKSAGGYYAGNIIKLIRLRNPHDMDKILDLTEGTHFSAYRASWALPDPTATVLEAFQRAERRKDATARPYTEIREALRSAGMEQAKLIRTSAAGYEILTEEATRGQWSKLADILDLAGIAVKHNGAFIRSARGKAEAIKRWREMARKAFGAVGLHRQYAEMEMWQILSQVGIRDEVSVTPVYALGQKGDRRVYHKIEGLSIEQQADLQRMEVESAFGSMIRFGVLGNLGGDNQEEAGAECNNAGEITERAQEQTLSVQALMKHEAAMDHIDYNTEKQSGERNTGMEERREGVDEGSGQRDPQSPLAPPDTREAKPSPHTTLCPADHGKRPRLSGGHAAKQPRQY